MRCRACRAGKMLASVMPIARSVAGHTFRGTVRTLTCACGASEVPGEALEAFEISVGRALTNAPPTGEAARWIRKALGYTAVDLAALLGVRPETISRWERNERSIDHAAWAMLGMLTTDRRMAEAALRSVGAAELPADVTIS